MAASFANMGMLDDNFEQLGPKSIAMAHEAPLPPFKKGSEDVFESIKPRNQYTVLFSTTYTQTLLTFMAGVATCLVLQFILNVLGPHDNLVYLSSVGCLSSTGEHFPPPNPTNVVPSLFPTPIGFAGPTSTGAEPAIIQTAPSYPLHTGAPHLVPPSFNSSPDTPPNPDFDIFQHWGNLSPWFSVERGSFGVDSSPEAPEGCHVTGLHLLHRHGARYPTIQENTGYWSSTGLLGRLFNGTEKWTGHGSLSFLNNWTYKMGNDVLTSFGRQQLFDLGVSMRMKYGYLLQNFTESNTLPVFRTQSQDRMMASSTNFAMGFFGYPIEDQYQQSILITSSGESGTTFNSTLASYQTCPNFAKTAGSSLSYVQNWTNTYLFEAHRRLQPQLTGLNLTINDVHTMQQFCAYETVAIGYSKFCELFTEQEWEGFSYAFDLVFWYSMGFGSPVSSALGIGYVQELVARLTNTPISVHNSSTNGTLNDNPITFPLDQSLYVDTTHDITIISVLTALNLTNFAATGPLPADHIPKDRSFKVSHLTPFAANVQFQLLQCEALPDPQIRIVINDGVTSLTSVKGCPEQKDGMCPLSTFIKAQKERIRTVDWGYTCHGNWTDSWNVPVRDHSLPAYSDAYW